MQYLIRFANVHETFRKPEIEALAALANVDVEFVFYNKDSIFCTVKLKDEGSARALISRSILAKGIYELWGSGKTYEEIHADVQKRTSHQWSKYNTTSFKFLVDAFQGKRSPAEQNSLIQSFSYLGFKGPIRMNHPDQEFCIFEEWKIGGESPQQLHLGRWVGGGDRNAINKLSLKKRKYISTTSMDSELALITANLTLAAPDTLFFDPFVGTGSFPIACSYFGAVTLGSDIDGRSVRGKNGRDIITNFKQYGLMDRYLGSFISDLTNTPLRENALFDGIVCDPPYGVREGLKVLGRVGKLEEAIIINGKPAYMQDDYIPPKRAYSFEAMLDDILHSASVMLVENGRLSVWMPTANDEDVELLIPSHPGLEIGLGVSSPTESYQEDKSHVTGRERKRRRKEFMQMN
ncbi:MAG: tRNA methyltransferase 11 [Cirrosporium novae-zelandiae]|nr:MAG: tRNA methyltransferase 11 [Cirrosporium novae-zelandiae]